MTATLGGGISVLLAVVLADTRCLPEAEPEVRARIACGGSNGWLPDPAPSVTSVTLPLGVVSVVAIPLPLPPVGFAGSTTGDDMAAAAAIAEPSS